MLRAILGFDAVALLWRDNQQEGAPTMTQAGNVTYNGPEDLPATVPVFPLTGVLLLPRGHLR